MSFMYDIDLNLRPEEDESITLNQRDIYVTEEHSNHVHPLHHNTGIYISFYTNFVMHFYVKEYCDL